MQEVRVRCTAVSALYATQRLEFLCVLAVFCAQTNRLAQRATKEYFHPAALSSLTEATQQEFCICAAILMPDGYIVRGHRHDDCYITIGFYKKRDTDETRYDKGQLHQAVQGFLTTGNRFVNRKDGAALMVAVGHISAHTKQPFVGDMLFSEDLY